MESKYLEHARSWARARTDTSRERHAEAAVEAFNAEVALGARVRSRDGHVYGPTGARAVVRTAAFAGRPTPAVQVTTSDGEPAVWLELDDVVVDPFAGILPAEEVRAALAAYGAGKLAGELNVIREKPSEIAKEAIGRLRDRGDLDQGYDDYEKLAERLWDDLYGVGEWTPLPADQRHQLVKALEHVLDTDTEKRLVGVEEEIANALDDYVSVDKHRMAEVGELLADQDTAATRLRAGLLAALGKERLEDEALIQEIQELRQSVTQLRNGLTFALGGLVAEVLEDDRALIQAVQNLARELRAGRGKEDVAPWDQPGESFL